VRLTLLVTLMCFCQFGCDQAPGSYSAGKMDASETEDVAWIGPYKVLKVADGDSFSVQKGRASLAIRLFGIDAPEHDQPGSDESRSAARQLLLGQKVWLVVEDTDRYGRIVAWVFLQQDGSSINQQLVSQGMAWVYQQYSEAPELIEAEQQARATRRGIWRRPETQQIPPWEWRKRKIQ